MGVLVRGVELTNYPSGESLLSCSNEHIQRGHCRRELALFCNVEFNNTNGGQRWMATVSDLQI